MSFSGKLPTIPLRHETEYVEPLLPSKMFLEEGRETEGDPGASPPSFLLVFPSDPLKGAEIQ